MRFPSARRFFCSAFLTNQRVTELLIPIVQQAEQRRGRVSARDGRSRCHSKRAREEENNRLLFQQKGKKNTVKARHTESDARHGVRRKRALSGVVVETSRKYKRVTRWSEQQRACCSALKKKKWERKSKGALFFLTSLLEKALPVQNRGTARIASLSLALRLSSKHHGPLRRLGGLLGQGEAPRRLDARR